MYRYGTGLPQTDLDLAAVAAKVPPGSFEPRRHNVQVSSGRRSRHVGFGGGDGPEKHRHGSRRWAGDDGQRQRTSTAVTVEERQRTSATLSMEKRQCTGTTFALEVR